MKDAIKKSEILIESLPYIKHFQDKVIVVKYGGSALVNKKKRHSVLKDIIFMSLAGMKPVIVHGGGPFINKKLKKLKCGTRFIDGLRVSGEKEVKIIEDVLSRINRRIVREIAALGGNACGLAGKKIIKVKRHRKFKELGYVGEIRFIDTGRIKSVYSKDSIPVISPLGTGKDKNIYNINADQASAHVARALAAEKLALLTNVEGVYKDINNKDTLLSSLTKSKAQNMLKKGCLNTGMLPKIKACIFAIRSGVRKAHIINGSLPHALLLEIFTDKGIGTEIIK
ncbi:MAG: acetylglutamate kinase [Candidatus Omnitrophota bacterium]|nr:acetylglutamate kinase [Candidatus Omnitrophota bacterium]